MIKKSLLVPCLILLIEVSGCSSNSNNDKILLENYFANCYSNPFLMNGLTCTKTNWEMLTNYSIAGLKGHYNVNYSFSCPSGKIKISNSTNFVTLDVSPSALGKEFTDIPVNVGVAVEGAFNATYTMTCRYRPYTNYFAYILLSNLTLKKGYQVKGGTSLCWQSVASGHYYTDHNFWPDFSKNVCTYYEKKYEKMTGAPYNVREYNAVYYFGDGNPRIEGLTTGTFYVNGSTYTSNDTADQNAYYWSKAANDVFKQYGDTAYITDFV